MAIAIGFTACSSKSLWIDEFVTLTVAGKSGFTEFLTSLANNPYSESQMPLYLVYLWGWISLFGSSERALHLANMPWLIIAVGACLFWIRDRIAARWAIALILLSPFFWYYLDEARPYAAQIGGATLMMGILWPLLAQSKKGVPVDINGTQAVVFMVGSLLCCSINMLGVPWFLSLLLAVGYAILSGKARFRLGKPSTAAVISFFVLMGALAVYYFTTLLRGASPALKQENIILEFGFAAYEHLGFAGLGPSRNSLRDNGLGAFSLSNAGAAIMAVAYVVLVLLVPRRSLVESLVGKKMFLAILLGIPLLFLLALSWAKGFRVVGRHMSPALPLVAFGLAAILAWSDGSKKKRLAAGGTLLALLLCSSLMIRFSPLHEDDDYQSAVAETLNLLERNDQVWWVADPKGFRYYSPNLGAAEEQIEVFNHGDTMGTDTINNKRRPDSVVLSKHDIFDQKGVIRKYLAERGFEGRRISSAFVIYENPKK